ncbi:hypothetical protein CERSUDRAFT_77061 [Gelatoporia subvermispora B]|uniref:Uncharacterized protein n=1 Tax=Ceriporiopsis subvermispora (strain B) TaxID=914234 RepID=M2Q872_CERS8|nr:hypothetical protein CERSUDRAFT_77061 [Gelatoporia subvermispora B]
MDYDRYDAFLHHIFKQTQGDAWFRPHEDTPAAGAAPEFRVFPYENLALERFEAAVRALNPVVAVKVRSAAVHAALAKVGPDDRSIYVDANTRIQIVETMMDLPTADKEQSAAFIRDERVLVVWSDSLDNIIPTTHDSEERLIKLLWRSRPGAFGPGSISGHSLQHIISRLSQGVRRGSMLPATPGTPGTPRGMGRLSMELSAEDLEKAPGMVDEKDAVKTKTKRTWWGGKKTTVVENHYGDEEDNGPEPRPALLLVPIYNGLAAGLSIFFIANGVDILLKEMPAHNPRQFFSLQIVQNVSMVLGPIAQIHENSKYYSAVPPRPNKIVDNNLPHITIQMLVYKEGLDTVLVPSITSLKKAMQTYARQGGTSSIFINDDGLRLLPVEERNVRIAYYEDHGIGSVARPKHDPAADGFKCAGCFKKVLNMNYGLALSLGAEKHLLELQAQRKARSDAGVRVSSSGDHGVNEEMRYGMQYQQHDGEDQGSLNDGRGEHRDGGPYEEWEDLEERALQMAIDEVYEASGRRFRPWAANGCACRLGEIVLIVDSDAVVPEDCLRDATREMTECPTVAIIQQESDVMQVAHPLLRERYRLLRASYQQVYLLHTFSADVSAQETERSLAVDAARRDRRDQEPVRPDTGRADPHPQTLPATRVQCDIALALTSMLQVQPVQAQVKAPAPAAREGQGLQRRQEQQVQEQLRVMDGARERGRQEHDRTVQMRQNMECKHSQEQDEQLTRPPPLIATTGSPNPRGFVASGLLSGGSPKSTGNANSITRLHMKSVNLVGAAVHGAGGLVLCTSRSRSSITIHDHPSSGCSLASHNPLASTTTTAAVENGAAGPEPDALWTIFPIPASPPILASSIKGAKSHSRSLSTDDATAPITSAALKVENSAMKGTAPESPGLSSPIGAPVGSANRLSRSGWKRHKAKLRKRSQISQSTIGVKVRIKTSMKYRSIQCLRACMSLPDICGMSGGEASCIFPTKPGWIGLNKVHGVTSNEVITLDEARANGWKVIAWDGRMPLALADTSQHVFAVFVGKPFGDESWDGNTAAAGLALDAVRNALHLTSKQHRRGHFPTSEMGFSFGGGQQRPMNFQHSEKQAAQLQWLCRQWSLWRIARFVNRSLSANWKEDLVSNDHFQTASLQVQLQITGQEW